MVFGVYDGNTGGYACILKSSAKTGCIVTCVFGELYQLYCKLNKLTTQLVKPTKTAEFAFLKRMAYLVQYKTYSSITLQHFRNKGKSKNRRVLRAWRSTALKLCLCLHLEARVSWAKTRKGYLKYVHFCSQAWDPLENPNPVEAHSNVQSAVGFKI